MSCHSPVTAWTTLIRLHLPHVSQPQATVLTLWSVGMVLARSCALTAVTACLAGWLRRQEQTVRQQLRECGDEAEATRGDQRQARGVECGVVPLLVWVLSRWQGTQLALARAATTLGTRWRGTGTAFNSRPRPRRGTRLACWEAGDTAPWWILTALPPEVSDAGGYGLRAWIAPGFKLTTRAGWPWQRTRLTEPPRAARRWLAVAVATLWRLSVGGAAEETIPEGTRLDVSEALACQRRQHRATRVRVVSMFRRGWLLILVALLNQAPLPLRAFVPDPWPMSQTQDDTVMRPYAAVHHDAAASKNLP